MLPAVIADNDSGHNDHHEEVHALLARLDGQTDFTAPGLQEGILADRPIAAAGNAGMFYFSTDSVSLAYSNGLVWRSVPFATGDAVFDGDVFFGSGQPWRDVRHPAYAAASDGTTVDTTPWQDALDDVVADGGGIVYGSRGTSYYKVDAELTIDTTVTVEVVLAPGAELRQTGGNNLAGIVASNCTHLTIKGKGKITGPGMGSATAGSHGVELTASPGTEISDVEISGFYHGVRPNAASTFCKFLRLFLHDLAFAGIFPHTGDLVSECRFKTIGTTFAHHGIYCDEAVAGLLRCIANIYEAITGAAVHIFSLVNELWGMSFVGETFTGCYTAYYFGEFKLHNIEVTGATINGCTDRAVVISGNLYGSSFQFTAEGSTGRNLEVGSGGVVLTIPYDITVNCTSRGGAGCWITANGVTAAITASASTGDGVRVASATYVTGTATVRSNTGDGLRLSGSSTRCTIRTESNGNTGNGVDLFPGTVTGNTIDGDSIGNTAGQLVNSAGAGNDVARLKVV